MPNFSFLPPPPTKNKKIIPPIVTPLVISKDRFLNPPPLAVLAAASFQKLSS